MHDYDTLFFLFKGHFDRIILIGTQGFNFYASKSFILHLFKHDLIQLSWQVNPFNSSLLQNQNQTLI
jgi:hypothetical protein